MRWKRTGETRGARPPWWYNVIVLAKDMGVPPWDLIEKPAFWAGAAQGVLEYQQEEDRTKPDAAQRRDANQTETWTEGLRADNASAFFL